MLLSGKPFSGTGKSGQASIIRPDCDIDKAVSGKKPLNGLFLRRANFQHQPSSANKKLTCLGNTATITVKPVPASKQGKAWFKTNHLGIELITAVCFHVGKIGDYGVKPCFRGKGREHIRAEQGNAVDEAMFCNVVLSHAKSRSGNIHPDNGTIQLSGKDIGYHPGAGTKIKQT